jgi:excisionase family DNA binding protein
MARRHNGRRVKIHRSYTITEAAVVLGVHKHTVSRWIAAGLPTTDDRRPFLIHGEDLRVFLKAREPVKRSCRPGEFYCLSCRAPRRPAGDMADYIPKSATRGLLRGICPVCDRLIHRAVSLVTIEQQAGGLIVTYQRAEQRIDDTSPPLSNVDFKQDKRT